MKQKKNKKIGIWKNKISWEKIFWTKIWRILKKIISKVFQNRKNSFCQKDIQKKIIVSKMFFSSFFSEKIKPFIAWDRKANDWRQAYLPRSFFYIENLVNEIENMLKIVQIKRETITWWFLKELFLLWFCFVPIKLVYRLRISGCAYRIW